MDRDLDIMKGIIAKLVGEGQQTWGPFDQGVRGVYLEGYGVLFYLPASYFDGLAFKDFMQNRLTISNELEARLEVLQSELDGIAAGADSPEKARLHEEIAQLKREQKVTDKGAKKPIDEARRNAEERDRKLIEFLKYYADAINQLNDQDRISIIVDQNKSAFRPKPAMTIGESVSNGLREISAIKKDLVAYRKGRISDSEFENLVSIREIETNDRALKEVDVFAGIIGTALGRSKNSGFNTGTSIRGMRIRDLGAVFFMVAEMNTFGLQSFGPVILGEEGSKTVTVPSTPVKIAPAPNGEEGSITVTVPAFKNSGHQEDTDKKIKAFKAELVGVLGDYGHTLRTLKDSEYVVVSVDISSLHTPFMGDGPSGFVVKVQKSILDQYDTKRLDFDAFMNKVQFIDL